MKPSNARVYHLFTANFSIFLIAQNGVKCSVKNFKSDKTNACEQFQTTQKSILIIIQHSTPTTVGPTTMVL